MDVLNLFYLCVSLLQIIPIFNTGYVFTFIAPLVFIIFVSLINEIVDDFKRFIKDLENNNEIYYTLGKDGNFEKIYSKNIKVGDIILIKSKQRVPADCILLKNLNKNGDYLLKKEEKKSFCKLKLTKKKNTNIYNKVNKNYYHFNKNIDNELIDERFNETGNAYGEPCNNLLLSENERKTSGDVEASEKRNEKGEDLLLLKRKWKNDEAMVNYKTYYNHKEKKSKKKVKEKEKRKVKEKKKNNKNAANDASENYTYVKTDKIDGETDWKIKYPISIFQNIKKLSDFFLIDILFVLEEPKNDIYNIDGSYVMFKCHDFVEFGNNDHDFTKRSILDFSFREDKKTSNAHDNLLSNKVDSEKGEIEEDEEESEEEEAEESEEEEEESEEEEEEAEEDDNEYNDNETYERISDITEERGLEKQKIGKLKERHNLSENGQIYDDLEKCIHKNNDNNTINDGNNNNNNNNNNKTYHNKNTTNNNSNTITNKNINNDNDNDPTDVTTFHSQDNDNNNNDTTINNNKSNGNHTANDYFNGIINSNRIVSIEIPSYTQFTRKKSENPYLDAHNACILYKKSDFNFYDIKYKKKLNYDNIILFNSVITSSDVICLVIYTGSDTRVNMSTQISKIKKGMIDKKLNIITIFLFLILSIFSLYMCFFKFNNLWYLNFVRFVLLFSSVIPISLSVNLNVAKIYYTLLIQNDKEIHTTIIKNNSVIEDLGDVDFLFTDKTGTLTENIMILKVIHFGYDVLYTEKENEKRALQYKKTRKKFLSEGYSSNNFLKDIADENGNNAESFNEASTLEHNKENEKKGNYFLEKEQRMLFDYKMKKMNKQDNLKMRQLYTKEDIVIGNKRKDLEEGHMRIMAETNYTDIRKDPEKAYDYRMNSFSEQKSENEWRKKKDIGSKGGRTNSGYFHNDIKEQGDHFANSNSIRRKKKVERIVDEFLKKNTNEIYDYYNDEIDDDEYLKKHRVFQTFLSFLLCNNIRTLTKDSDENDEGEIKKKEKLREKKMQKNFYYILNVSGKNKRAGKKEKEENLIKRGGKNKVNIMDKEENEAEEEENEEEQPTTKNCYPINTSKKDEVHKSYHEDRMDINGNFNNNNSSNISDNSETFSHGDVSYQCSSPDELAFLKYATNCGFILKKKTGNTVVIQYKNITFEYEVLLHIPFSSETKRMSVFVRNRKNRNIYFFIKGADNILIQKCHEKYKTFIYEESDHLSNLGLRVLVHGVLNVEEIFFKNFYNLYNEKKDAKGTVDQVLALVEKNIKVLAITGVEDKLQQGVGKTIEMLYNSGIKVWVLTGDKIETAICACKNANIKKKKNNICIFRHEQINNTTSLIRAFNSILNNIESYVLFFDNITIQNCIKYMPNAFVDFAVNARAVVCCRCSPIEKKEIALLIKNIKKKKVLCIGDGGNDVAMIQSADIGIGVLGREGKQVVHDSDIIVSKFKNIKKLILYYGNNTFLQTSSLCSFLIHRGFILTYLQFIYSYIFFFIPVSIFQGWLQIGYTTYYTTAPFLSLLLDIKIKKNLIYLYPEIYKNKKHKRKLDLKSFFTIIWISIFQGTVVMLGALKLFNDSYTNLINISFSSLIILEIMNIHLEVEEWHPLMISANLCSFIVYIISIFTLRNYFDVMAIMSVLFWYKVILIVIFAWFPFYLIKKIKNFFTPSQFFKLT